MFSYLNLIHILHQKWQRHWALNYLGRSLFLKNTCFYIEGQLTTRKWKDEQSGQDKYSTEIVIQGYNSSLTMLGGGGGTSNLTSSNNNQEVSQISDTNLDDDIPF